MSNKNYHLGVKIAFAASIVIVGQSMVSTSIQRAAASNSPSQMAAYRETVQSFPANSFNPVGFISSNAHWQTISGSGALQSKFFGSPKRPFSATPERIITPDGDFFDVEYVGDLSGSKGIVVLLHGLESNIKGNQITSYATAMMDKGFSCCLVSFRGCNGEDNRTPGAYHLGFTTDVNQITQIVLERYPNQRIYLCGFSLGGNVVLKFLGELGEDAAASRNIHGAAVACVPFDPVASQGKLDVGFNRAVYSMNFLSTLKKKAERQILEFPGAFDIERIRQCNTIGEFDEVFIANIYGFRDKVDYYRSTGSKWWMPKIRVPAIAINARDDPFIEEASLPTEADIGPEAPVRAIYHANGGHCGFQIRSTAVNPVPAHGWLAEELSRALSHIHERGTNIPVAAADAATSASASVSGAER